MFPTVTKAMAIQYLDIGKGQMVVPLLSLAVAVVTVDATLWATKLAHLP